MGPSPIVCCPSAHPCCAGDARGSGSRAGAVSIGGVHAAPRPQPESVTDALHACSTRSEREALHPLRRATPVTSQCTRYVALHPIRRGAMPTDRVHRLPQQAQPRAIRPHRPQPPTSDAATQLRHARPAPNERRCTRYVAIHPLRRNAPVTSRYTRYVAIHPIRRGVMLTDRVHRLPQQAQIGRAHV